MGSTVGKGHLKNSFCINESGECTSKAMFECLNSLRQCVFYPEGREGTKE